MKTKFLSVILLIAILVTIIASMVAAVNFTAPATVDLSKTVSSATFEVDNTLNSNDVTVPSSLSISDGFGKTIALTVSDATSTGKVEKGTKEVITVSYTTLPTELALGTHSAKLTLTDAVVTTDKLDVTVDFESSFCEFGCTEDPDLDLDVKIDNVRGFGEEDEEWYPLYEIEVEVTVDNKGDDTKSIGSISSQGSQRSRSSSQSG